MKVVLCCNGSVRRREKIKRQMGRVARCRETWPSKPFIVSDIVQSSRGEQAYTRCYFADSQYSRAGVIILVQYTLLQERCRTADAYCKVAGCIAILLQYCANIVVQYCNGNVCAMVLEYCAHIAPQYILV